MKRRPDGFWTFDNTIHELNSIIMKIGHFPTERELNHMNFSSLIYYMCKYGGINKFREILGYQITHKPLVIGLIIL